MITKEAVTFVIPEKLKNLLTTLELSSKVIDSHSVSVAESSLLQINLLKDSLGQLVVVMPANSILELSKLCELMGRNFIAADVDRQTAVIKTGGVEFLSPFPQLHGIPILVDQNLHNMDAVFLPFADKRHLLCLPKAATKKLWQGCLQARFSVPLRHQPDTDSYLERDKKQLIKAVQNFTPLRIQRRLSETLEIPPLPQTAPRIIKLRVDPDADLNDLANIVETDPSLAAQVVSWASSPYYGTPGTVKSVHDAVIRVLGFDLVINLSLGLALGKTLVLPEQGAMGVTPYWQQAVFTAATMEKLVGLIPFQHRPALGLAYLTGLLHNYGYLILSHVFPPHFELVNRHIEANPHLHHWQVEEYLLGINREQMSSWLMRLWQMPEEVCVALRFQHHPGYSGEHKVYAQLLNLALGLLQSHGVGDQSAAPAIAQQLEHLHIDAELAQETMSNLMDSASELNDMAANLQR